jgi:hypothetical protein
MRTSRTSTGRSILLVMSERVDLYLAGISPALNEAVGKEIARQKSNRNDVVGEILARRFGTDFARSGLTRLPGMSSEWTLSVSRTLRRRLKQEAAERETNVRDLVVEVLSEHFRVPFTPVFHSDRRRESWKRKEEAA